LALARSRSVKALLSAIAAPAADKEAAAADKEAPPADKETMRPLLPVPATSCWRPSSERKASA